MKSDFLIALTQLAAERGLPREIVVSAIQDALASAYGRDSIAAGQDISVKLDPGSGDVSVFRIKTVVEKVVDPLAEISLAKARKVDPAVEIGSSVTDGVIEHNSGRIAAQAAKQVVLQRLREAERDLIYQEYADKEGEVFSANVQKLEHEFVVVEIGRAEATLPNSEQPPFERYRVGQKIKVLLQSVRLSNRGPELIVSRVDKLLLKRLFEMEVPEIYNGSVEIVSIAREAGARSKVAVWAKQDGVDAVGSCVGLRGIRIQNIVNEMQGEKVDVVQWYKDPAAYISRSLSPSEVVRVEINEEERSAVAVVPDKHLSLAIGKEGQNARLAAKLTGWKVDIKSNVEVEQETSEVDIDGPELVSDESKKQIQDSVSGDLNKDDQGFSVEPPDEHVTVDVVDSADVSLTGTESAVQEQIKDEDVPDGDGSLKVEAEQPEVAQIEESGNKTVDIPEEMFEGIVKPSVVEVDKSTALGDLSEDVWRVRSGRKGDEGVIRFAEDIDEIKARRGSIRGKGKKGPKGSGANRTRKHRS